MGPPPNTSLMEAKAAVATPVPCEMLPATDEELLARAGTDPEAFAELYHRHFRRVVAFAVRRCARGGEVADLVAAVWLEVIGSADRYDPARGPALPWKLGIAANLSASETRRRAREQQAVDRLAGHRLLDEDETQLLEAKIDAARVAPRIREAMASLRAGERAMVELVVLDGLTSADAAVALGLDRGGRAHAPGESAPEASPRLGRRGHHRIAGRAKRSRGNRGDDMSGVEVEDRPRGGFEERLLPMLLQAVEERRDAGGQVPVGERPARMSEKAGRRPRTRKPWRRRAAIVALAAVLGAVLVWGPGPTCDRAFGLDRRLGGGGGGRPRRRGGATPVAGRRRADHRRTVRRPGRALVPCLRPAGRGHRRARLGADAGADRQRGGGAGTVPQEPAADPHGRGTQSPSCPFPRGSRGRSRSS